MLQVQIGSHDYSLSTKDGNLQINGASHEVDLEQVDRDKYHMIVDGKGYTVEVVSNDPGNFQVKVNGKIFSPKVKTETDLLLERLGMNMSSKKEVKELKAPMPGLVLDYRVSVGDQVEEGTPLVVLEAMKMENILKSPAAGIVNALGPDVGSAIEKNTLLISFE